MEPWSAPGSVEDIEGALREHPFVGSVSVSEEEAANGSRYSVAYVVPSGAWDDATETQSFGPELDKRVTNWQRIFDGTYRQPDESAPDFIGWTSSYTNRPLPEHEMREWLNATIECIADLAPKRVFEIGCGVGLIVEALAPSCEAYCGTDFSATAIDRLREFTTAKPELRHVDLLQREAINFDGLTPQSFDTVVINSVVQYFPHLDYLKLVLERAVEMVAPGGSIFVGDVRHLGLLGAFHCSVQFAKAAPEATIRSLKHKIALAIEQEKELVIDPLFFLELPRRFPRIAGAEIMVKRGAADNELTRYRYDVVLHIGEVCSTHETSSFAGRVEDLNPASNDCAVRQLLDAARDDETVKDLQDRVAAFDPTRVCRADLKSSASRPLATDPMAVALRNGLAVSLARFLRSRLPDAPLPTSVVVLSGNTTLPLGTPAA